MIALADYGASNTRSVLRALLAAGAEAPTLTDDPATLRRAERVVLPGVGNFAAAKRRLDETGLGEAITDVAKSGRPVLGICLGLQLFLADSEEAPGVPGLGLLPGRVARFHTELPVPHVGWARVRLTAGGRAHGALAAAFDGDEAFFYHVHSYHPVGVDATGALAEAEYGGPFPTIVGAGGELREETGCDPIRLYNASRVESFYRHRVDEVALGPVFVAFVDRAAEPRLSPEHDRAEWLAPAEAAARLAWPRERRALKDILSILGGGDAGLLDDVLRIC